MQLCSVKDSEVFEKTFLKKKKTSRRQRNTADMLAIRCLKQDCVIRQHRKTGNLARTKPVYYKT